MIKTTIKDYDRLWNLIRVDSQTQDSPVFWTDAYPVLDRHSLLGLVFSSHQKSIPQPTLEFYKKNWKQQFIRNSFYQEELKILGGQILKIDAEVCLLKGGALLETIYTHDIGARFMGDIDLLVSEPCLEPLIAFLRTLGYQEVPSSRWSANSYKRNFSRVHHGVELVFELHTKLLWREPKVFTWNKIPSQIPGFSRLAPEDELTYLTGHLGYQHTFLHLGWLVDLDRLIRFHGENLHWPRIVKIAQTLGIRNSLFATLQQCSRFLGTPLPPLVTSQKNMVLNWLAGERFLWDPDGYSTQYYLLKHLLKDSIWESLKYDLLWARNRIFNREKLKFSKASSAATSVTNSNLRS